MYFDNRIFNVNGHGDEGLMLALTLAFMQEGNKTMVRSYSTDDQRGMVLYWGDKEGNMIRQNFPCAMTADDVFPLVKAYLNSEVSKGVVCADWDADYDHDGSNTRGWRLYCDAWGHIDGISASDIIIAIKPAYVWHGK